MPQFKDKMGNFLTQGLFYELSYANPEYVMYTLKDEDIEAEIGGEVRKLPSIKKLYLSCEDPTEYEFATKYLGGWKHWKRICEKTSSLKPHIEEWREELEVKLRAKGIKQMIAHAQTDKGFQSAKWLAEKGWEEKKAGRPTKEQIEREAKQLAKVKSSVVADLERIRKMN